VLHPSPSLPHPCHHHSGDASSRLPSWNLCYPSNSTEPAASLWSPSAEDEDEEDPATLLHCGGRPVAVEPGAPPHGPPAGAGDDGSCGSAREKKENESCDSGDNRRCDSPSLGMEEGHTGGRRRGGERLGRGGRRRRERKEQGSGDKAGTKEMRPALPSRWHGRVGQPYWGWRTHRYHGRRRSMGMRPRVMGRWRCGDVRQGIGCWADRKKRVMDPTKTSPN
jgi:hypothetical protein